MSFELINISVFKFISGFACVFLFLPIVDIRPVSWVAAAVFGWIFMNIPKTLKKEMEWVYLLSCIGIVAVVGCLVGSILEYVADLPYALENSICAFFGSKGTFWIDRLHDLAAKKADKIEDAMDDSLLDSDNTPKP